MMGRCRGVVTAGSTEQRGRKRARRVLALRRRTVLRLLFQRRLRGLRGCVSAMDNHYLKKRTGHRNQSVANIRPSGGGAPLVAPRPHETIAQTRTRNAAGADATVHMSDPLAGRASLPK
jgi:hypothetical protein